MSPPRTQQCARIEAHKASILSALADTTPMGAMIDSELSAVVGEALRFLAPALTELRQAGMIDCREVWHPGRLPFMCYWRAEPVAQADSATPPHRTRDKGRDERRHLHVTAKPGRPKGVRAVCDDGLVVPEKRASVRTCLCCRREFISQGFHNRLCTTCRAKSVGPYDL